jgi:hypothetical protein
MTTIIEALRQVDEDWRAYARAVVTLCELAADYELADYDAAAPVSGWVSAERGRRGNQLSIQLARVSLVRRIWLESNADFSLAREAALF